MTPKQHWKLAWRRARTTSHLRFALSSTEETNRALNGLSLKPVLSRADYQQQAWLGLYGQSVVHRRDCIECREREMANNSVRILRIASDLEAYWLPLVTIKDLCRDNMSRRTEFYA